MRVIVRGYAYLVSFVYCCVYCSINNLNLWRKMYGRESVREIRNGETETPGHSPR
jgi:hypothetical protein